RAEEKAPLEKLHPADAASRHTFGGPFDSGPANFRSPQPVRADDGGGGMRFPDAYHPFETFGKDPIIGLHELYIARRRRDVTERAIVVWNLIDEFRVAEEPDPRVFPRVSRSDGRGSISAVIVHQQVFEPRIGLRQHALDALAEKIGGVVKRSHHTHQRDTSHAGSGEARVGYRPAFAP